MAKYHNRKVTRDGETFDSVKEYRRFCELRLLEKAGAVTDLRRQVKFELIPAQRIDGKVAERACSYVADFVYMENGQQVVEDTKGMRTQEYRLKRKLMLWVHGIRIRET
jgi:hypothetical protein